MTIQGGKSLDESEKIDEKNWNMFIIFSNDFAIFLSSKSYS